MTKIKPTREAAEALVSDVIDAWALGYHLGAALRLIVLADIGHLKHDRITGLAEARARIERVYEKDLPMTLPQRPGAPFPFTVKERLGLSTEAFNTIFLLHGPRRSDLASAMKLIDDMVRVPKRRTA